MSTWKEATSLMPATCTKSQDTALGELHKRMTARGYKMAMGGAKNIGRRKIMVGYIPREGSTASSLLDFLVNQPVIATIGVRGAVRVEEA